MARPSQTIPPIAETAGSLTGVRLYWVPTGYDPLRFFADQAIPLRSFWAVVVPNEASLSSQAALARSGPYNSERVAFFSRELPPHAIRELWQQAESGLIDILFLSEKSFGSVQTQQALLETSRLQGILFCNPAEILLHGRKFSKSLLQNQALPRFLLSPPISRDGLARLAEAFGPLDPVTPVPAAILGDVTLQVGYHFTGYQKLQHVKRFLAAGNPSETQAITLLVTASPTQSEDLARRLKAFEPLMLSLSEEPQPLSAPGLYICEEQILKTLPPILSTLALPLRFIWWSGADSVDTLLSQLSWPEARPVEALVLHTREDCMDRQSQQAKRFSQQPDMKRFAKQSLATYRNWILQRRTCRRVALADYCPDFTSPLPCNRCDTCLSDRLSSRWMNLLARLLY